MTKLYIVRHGECQANVDGVVAGALFDSPLTERGELQAEEVAGVIMLKRRSFERIICSNLSRAIDSARIIKDALGLSMDIEIDERFTERNVGDATGMELEEYQKLEKSGEPINGAEHERVMYMRIKDGLKAIKDERRDTLLVTHNGTYRMIYCILTGRPPEDFAFVGGMNNGEIKELQFN